MFNQFRLIILDMSYALHKADNTRKGMNCLMLEIGNIIIDMSSLLLTKTSRIVI